MICHYCRVSTKEQHLDRQINALSSYKKADKVYTDKMSGKDFNRDGYQQMKRELVAGDEVIVKELDRLGRNKDEVKTELDWFRQKGVTVRILDVPTTLIEFGEQRWVQEMINNIIVEVLAAVAEQERKKIHDRMMEGLQAKRDRGEWNDMGRPKKDTSEFEKFLKKQKDGQMTVDECCEAMSISRSTWYARVRGLSA